MNSTTQYQPISVSLPRSIIDKIDTIAEESYKSRSDVIREALMARAIPTYELTKDEAKALSIADKDMKNGNVTDWDTFINNPVK